MHLFFLSHVLCRIVIGSGGTGKSALTIQYIQETFVDKYDPTIEDSYRKQVEVDGRAVMLDILDTAGQDEYSAMRDDYMAQGNGFLMVYSITDFQSFEDCNKIHEALIRMKTPEDPSEEMPPLPLILAGNKSDLEEERSVTTEEGKELAAKFGEYCKFFETSAKERINVDEVFEELVRLINKVESGASGNGGDADQENDVVHPQGEESNLDDSAQGGEGSTESGTNEHAGSAKPAEKKPATTPAKPKKKGGGCTLL